MVLDLYSTLKSDPSYNKLIGNNYMFTEYKCPLETDRFHMYAELHFIMYIVSGQKDWTSSGKNYQLKGGDLVFVKKGVYTTKQYFDEDHCVMLLFLNDDLIKSFIKENKISSSVGSRIHTEQIVPIEKSETLNTTLFSMYNYLRSPGEIPLNLVELKFKEILFNIILNPANLSLLQFFISLSGNNKSNIETIMLKHFQYDLQLEEFARLCGRSLSAFKRDFINIYSQTPGKWLNEKRLEYAESLLRTSSMNINEICLESGFRNSSHFSKAFKQKYLVAPLKYRMHSHSEL